MVKLLYTWEEVRDARNGIAVIFLTWRTEWMSDNSLTEFKKNWTYLEIIEMWVLGPNCQRCWLYVSAVGFRDLWFKYMWPPSPTPWSWCIESKGHTLRDCALEKPPISFTFYLGILGKLKAINQKAFSFMSFFLGSPLDLLQQNCIKIKASCSPPNIKNSKRHKKMIHRRKTFDRHMKDKTKQLDPIFQLTSRQRFFVFSLSLLF